MNSRRAFLLFAVAVGACGGDASSPGTKQPPSPPVRPGLHFVNGDGLRDTVMSLPRDSLIVELRDANNVVISGVRVRVEVLADTDGARTVALYDRATLSYASAVEQATRPDGRVAIQLFFGTRAGAARLRATATTLGLADSATVVVLPGAPVRLPMAPGDTSIYVGGVARLRGTVTDRWNNTYADPVTWTTTTGSIVKVTTSGVATGIAIGRATLVAAGSGFRDSISISVVPPGVIAGDLTPAYSGARHQLIVVNTDGSGKSALSTGPGDNCGFIDIDWLPDRSGLIYAGSRFNSVCFDLRLMITTLSGTTRLVRPDTAPLAGERTPSYSPDGIWIYFGGIPEHQNLEFWRVPSNGTGAERLGPLADWYDVDGYPSPSPDGKQVVYSSNRTYRNSDRQTLKLFDVASRTSRDLLIEGFAPRWSPKGDLIAFISGGNYYVVRPDGSGQRRIATGKYNADRPSWSPDGRYLLVSATDPKASAPVYGRFAIVDVETGAVLPLGWTSQMFSPSWRP